MKKVTIIGLGYVGFPLLSVLAQNADYDVHGFDINDACIQNLVQQQAPIEDEFIAPIFAQQTVRAWQPDLTPQHQAMTVATNPEIMRDSDIFVVCVPTPVHKDFTPNLEPVKAATRSLVPYIKPGALIILESTVNPGVCEEVVLPILAESGLVAGKDFYFAYCPERINPGDSQYNVTNIARNVGAMTPQGLAVAATFYESFVTAEVKQVSSVKVAEASKIVENTFRDINIAFVNELAQSFDVMGIDVKEVIEAASNKPFAFMAHYPSCGVGGHCIPVDPYYLIQRADQAGFEHRFLKIAREVNNSMPAYTVELTEKMATTFEKQPKIGLFGLAYKKNISDMRESPALKIRLMLEKKYATIEVFDPYVLDQSTQPDFATFLNEIDFLVVATDHDELTQLTPEELQHYGIQAIVDGKNCLDKDAIQSAGIAYTGIGR